ncbi:hypothetical protein ACSQ67_018486 [Phaseolus vulgaris]
MPNTNHPFPLLFLLLLLHASSYAHSSQLQHRHIPPLVFTDASALLAFKLKADVNNHLDFSPSRAAFASALGPASNATLRVLSLQNNSLTGTIPDLTSLFNLKSLFLDNNQFTGSLPPSLFSLHRLRNLDFSHNNLSGPISAAFTNLDRLHTLRLSFNDFSGSIPPFNQSSLRILEISGNNLSGAIPVTPTLFRFPPSSFAFNPNLCGEIIRVQCSPAKPFFGSTPPPTAAIGQSAQVHGVNGIIGQPYVKKRHDRRAVIIGFSAGVFVLVCSLACFAAAVRKQRSRCNKDQRSGMMAGDVAATAEAAAVMRMEMERELEEKVKRAEVAKSGSLVFCAGEAHVYTLDQLMKGSAELLGRGCLGTTYKAALDNRLMVTVKRLDAGKMAAHATKEVFERHMESVGALRHPNLVPLRAYFQAKQERLIIYDFQPNGSLFSLIHGSRSSRARPLHWTSCLKIAEDVAQGLAFIHQAWRLVHGNLKSSNVLLGPDFEACITDYCLSVLTNPSTFDEDGDSAAYRAPETRNPNHQPTHKSDVYAYGILLLELLTGKFPSELPFMVPGEMSSWVRSIRDDNGGEDSRMDMLLQVATTCSLTSPEQRPTMWQVLKMLQEIKEIVLLEDTTELELQSGNAMP